MLLQLCGKHTGGGRRHYRSFRLKDVCPGRPPLLCLWPKHQTGRYAVQCLVTKALVWNVPCASLTENIFYHGWGWSGGGVSFSSYSYIYIFIFHFTYKSAGECEAKIHSKKVRLLYDPQSDAGKIPFWQGSHLLPHEESGLVVGFL